MDIPTRQAEAQLFLNKLDSTTETFVFQAFDDDKDRAKEWKRTHQNKADPHYTKTIAGTLLDCWDDLVKFNERGSGIFVTVNKTDGNKRKISNVTEIRALIADLDGSPLAPVLAWECPPNLVTNTSPGKFHCYWFVEWFPMDEWRKAQEFLIAKFNADPSIVDLPRVMRLPGFNHMKSPDNPYMVEINRDASDDGMPRYLDSTLRDAMKLTAAPDEPPQMNVESGLKPENVESIADYERAAINDYDAWVPALRGCKPVKTKDGWRIFDDEHEEALAFHPKGIKDFRVHDLGDERKGKRVPTDIVMEFMMTEEERERPEARHHATVWLCAKLGIDPPAERPIIIAKAGQLAFTADAAEKALLNIGMPIYQRGDKLMYPVIGEADAAYGKKTKIARFTEVDPSWLRGKLARHVQFKQFNSKGKLLPIDPPKDVVIDILARKDIYPFPSVTGIITCQTLRPDGSLLHDPGYDKATGLLLIAPPEMPEIAEHPTRADALEALSLFEDLLKEFPFVDEVSKAVALSALISPVARGAFSLCPMHAARAPTAGTGKSYMWDLASLIATGRLMPVMANAPKEEENEKRLDSALLAGYQMISIDNVNGVLKGDKLNQIITQTIVDVRVLGKLELPRVDTRGVSVFCTGNNIAFLGDLNRRAVTCNLNPNIERPELREFRGNPVKSILRDRGRFIAAALTICRAHLMSKNGCLRPLASFDGWSDTVRSALVWLGCADPVGSIEEARHEDVSLTTLNEVFTEWAKIMGTGEDSRLTLNVFLSRVRETDATSQDLRWPELHASLRNAMGSHREGIDPISLQYWLRNNNNRVMGNLKLMSKMNRLSKKEWWIANINGESTPGAYSVMTAAGGPGQGRLRVVRDADGDREPPF